ncbi:Hypothetical_protein [Hexamita inflata]|uniref:Hypothetical_protein n=1 Tax=Hexamita inflata TaxID=28002 RepID=A0AA86N6H4_9EUKA|nr:Hypothetical protein HINF_LOCUS1378 [Hexamita inflata]
MKGWMRFRARKEGQFFQFIPYAEGELLQLLQQYESQQIRSEVHTKLELHINNILFSLTLNLLASINFGNDEPKVQIRVEPEFLADFPSRFRFFSFNDVNNNGSEPELEFRNRFRPFKVLLKCVWELNFILVVRILPSCL